MSNINQREIIADILMDVLEEKKYNNLVLQEKLRENSDLNRIQKAFITECVNGTLRNLIYLDYIINFYSNTKTTKMKPYILNVLRMSVYQLKLMDKVPDSAICNEAVNLTKAKNFKNLSGFVNAVLRNIIRNTPKITFPSKEKNPVDYLSVMYSVEKWMIKYWLSEFSYEEIEKMLENQNQSPKITIAVNTLKTTKDELIKILEEEDISVTESNLIENTLYISKTSDITKKQSFINGLFHVMDESSMLAVKVLDPKENEIILDVAAAPGGKSFYISYITNDKANLFSYDLHSHKVDLIRKTKNRLGIKNLKPSLKDATIFDETKNETADKVLIDAPCSGFGMLQKKPDIKYTKTITDINTLSDLQKEILETSSKYVKKGGVLVYSTCTISKKENIDNVNWFLENFDFELEDVNLFLPNTIKSETKYLNLLPSTYDTDGFFIARFKRREQ